MGVMLQNEGLPRPGSISSFTEVNKREKKPSMNIDGRHDPDFFKDKTTRQRHVVKKMSMKGNFAPMIGLMLLQGVNALAGGVIFPGTFMRRRLTGETRTVKPECKKPETSAFGMVLVISFIMMIIGVLCGLLLKGNHQPARIAS